MQIKPWKHNLSAAAGFSLVLSLAPVTSAGAVQDPGQSAPIVIDAAAASAPPQPLPFPVGGQSSTGHTLSANNRYLMRDGKPWFPVMGEFHYSR